MSSSASPLHAPFEQVYRDQFDFVWRTLRAMGVPESGLDDALQDVFVVVHRRLPEFEGRAKVRTWTYEIARRVALRYRSRAAEHAARHTEVDDLLGHEDVEAQLDRTKAATVMTEFLWSLDEDRRRAFVLAEFWEMPGREIAEALGVNMNTVYARIRSARTELQRLAKRMHARDAGALTRAMQTPTPGSRDRVRAAVLASVPAATAATTTGGFAVLALGALALAVGGAAWALSPSPAPPPPAVTSSSSPPAPHPPSPPAAAVVEADAEPIPQAPSPMPQPRQRAQARPSPQPDLTTELAFVRALRAAARRGDDVSATLRDYASTFPKGTLKLEVEALGIESACRRSTPDAQTQWAAFQRAHPDDALLPRLEALCDSPKIAPQRPAGLDTHPR